MNVLNLVARESMYYIRGSCSVRIQKENDTQMNTIKPKASSISDDTVVAEAVYRQTFYVSCVLCLCKVLYKFFTPFLTSRPNKRDKFRFIIFFSLIQLYFFNLNFQVYSVLFSCGSQGCRYIQNYVYLCYTICIQLSAWTMFR